MEWYKLCFAIGVSGEIAGGNNMYAEIESLTSEKRSNDICVTVRLRGEMAEFVRTEIKEGMFGEPEELVYAALRELFLKQIHYPLGVG